MLWFLSGCLSYRSELFLWLSLSFASCLCKLPFLDRAMGASSYDKEQPSSCSRRCILFHPEKHMTNKSRETAYALLHQSINQSNLTTSQIFAVFSSMLIFQQYKGHTCFYCLAWVCAGWIFHVKPQCSEAFVVQCELHKTLEHYFVFLEYFSSYQSPFQYCLLYSALVYYLFMFLGCIYVYESVPLNQFCCLCKLLSIMSLFFRLEVPFLCVSCILICLNLLLGQDTLVSV